MRTETLVLVVCCAVIVTGCRPYNLGREVTGRLAPDDDEALAKEIFTALRSRDLDAVTTHLDSRLVKPGIESNLAAVADILNQGEPISVELVGCIIRTSSRKRVTDLDYQYQFTSGWAVASIRIETVGTAKKVLGVHVTPLPKSLKEINAFTFAGKGSRQYLIVLLAMAIPLFILATLVVCIRTKLRRRKWLWIIFILFGVGRLGLNWTTGRILYNPLYLSIQLFGAAAVKNGLYAPWIINISLPLGAMIFLSRRKKLAARQPLVEPESGDQGDGELPPEPSSDSSAEGISS